MHGVYHTITHQLLNTQSSDTHTQHATALEAGLFLTNNSTLSTQKRFPKLALLESLLSLPRCTPAALARTPTPHTISHQLYVALSAKSADTPSLICIQPPPWLFLFLFVFTSLYAGCASGYPDTSYHHSSAHSLPLICMQPPLWLVFFLKSPHRTPAALARTPTPRTIIRPLLYTPSSHMPPLICIQIFLGRYFSRSSSPRCMPAARAHTPARSRSPLEAALWSPWASIRH